jgi:hypothetical protein
MPIFGAPLYHHPSHATSFRHHDNAIGCLAKAVEAMSYLAQFFVDEARKSSRTWNGGSDTLRISYAVTPLDTSALCVDAWEVCYVF